MLQDFIIHNPDYSEAWGQDSDRLITELQAGRNPFDAETLKKLLSAGDAQ